MPQKPTRSREKSQKNLIFACIGALLACFILLAVTSGVLLESYFLLTTLTGVNPNPPVIRAPAIAIPVHVAKTTTQASTTSSASTPPTSPEKETIAYTPATVPKSSHDYAFGISVANTLTSLSEAELERRLDDIVSLHIGWLRLDFDWSVIQRRDSETFDWSKIDRVVVAASARGLKLLPILVYTPQWARGEACNSNRCPPNPDQFADFAVAAVKRYAQKGVHDWEIWNEPNMKGSWLPAADPAGYAALLKLAYTRIKKEDPTAVVITGGLGPIDTRAGNIAPREYLSALYNESAGSYFDAVGFHPYSFPVTASHDAFWNAWQQMENTDPSLRSIMVAHGDASKKIWITEYGAPTGGPGVASGGYSPNEHTDHVTEALQAEIIRDAIEQVRKYPWAGPLFWYTYKDLGTSKSTIENFFGIIRYDGSKKSTYEALQNALSAATVQ